ncbi:MAG: S8 family serine peptidase [Brumimicrobium sp.]
MKKEHILIFILFSFTTTLFGQLTQNKPNYVPNEVMVRMQVGESPYILERNVPAYFELKVEKELSNYSNIWLLKFNDKVVSIDDVLTVLLKENSVYLAQKNHYVTLRQAPNDPNYGNQWQHTKIDSELAWDITTGGTTPSNTDIVVAVIESADLINHPDLQDNHWVNTAEIPNNGIDDDGNGYIDDYNGWNASNNNDNIGTGSHGTSCAGMIGAKGNNGLGVAGINWDVKIMSIADSDNPYNEALVVAGYEYALQQRLIWNTTNGTQGAFVVATSASWGIDYGDPDDYPIWCGFYEDLGEVGILNAGATSNSSLNIDQTGDVPSACPSNYMISVTATNSSDIIDFAAYGQTTIDVAAPGSSIYTTAANGGYTSTSGTSFATPLTAGLIGLMYSVPCPNLETMAMTDPQGTADMVRLALMNGVDQTVHLSTRTVSGGRINAKTSIDLLMAEICSSCPFPTNISVSDIQGSSATISFDTDIDVNDYSIFYQIAGSGNWQTVTTTTGNSTITNLEDCTDYEYYIIANCDAESSGPTGTLTFTTTNCGNCIDLNYCETETGTFNTRFEIFQTSSAAGTHNYVPTTSFGGNVADGYKFGELVLVDDGSASPEEGCNTLINGSSLNGNIAVVVRGTCNFTQKVKNAQNAGAIAAIVVNNVATAPINMGGTDNTINIPAVMVTQSIGNSIIASINNGEKPMAILGKQNEWIESFVINGVTNNSGDNGGYLFTSGNINLNKNEPYDFTVTPGFDGQELSEYTRIWIDLNQDGNFGNDEIVYDQGNASKGAVSGQISIPSTATLGNTRMRVQMSFQPTVSPSLPNVCVTYNGGEVEDYCVEISEGTSSLVNYNKKSEVKIFPNPVKDAVTVLREDLSADKVVIYSSVGQVISKISLHQPSTKIDVKDWSNGIYFFHILDKNGQKLAVEKISVLP